MRQLEKKNIKDILMLSPLQEGMLFHYLKDPQSEQYHEQLSLKVTGEIKLELFEKAWHWVSKTNGMLRTVFRWEKLEKPTQIVLKEHTCTITYIDLSSENNNTTASRLLEIKAKDRQTPFDLHEVPFRIMLCKLGDKHYEIMISNHHILYDGWSNGILLKEFFGVYHDLWQGKKPHLPSKTPFKEFIQWLQHQDRTKQAEFWREYLEGFDSPTELPSKRKITGIKEAEHVSLVLEGALKEGLEDFVKHKRVTLAAVFYAAWGLLLQKYSGSDDVIFGTTVSGRSSRVKGIEEMVGLFINTIPLRTHTGREDKIGAVVLEMDRVLQAREEFENTPLTDIRGYSGVEGYESLFDTIVVIENYPLDSGLLPKDCALMLDSFGMVEMTHYDLTVGFLLFEKMEIKFSYNGSCLDKKTITNLAGHFKRILETIIKHPEMAVSQLEIITVGEKNSLLYEFNNTAKEYPTNKTIPQLFMEQAERAADVIALMDAEWGTQLSYGELNRQANTLANKLIAQGLLPEAIVALKMTRSVELIIGILGILKAGAIYLPIDPQYPAERIQFMLSDSAACIQITEQFFQETTPITPILPILPITPIIPTTPTNLAYIIYTSGSTGKPKGVLVRQSGIINLIHCRREIFNEIPGARTTQVASAGFDAMAGEVWPCLLNGATLVIADDETRADYFIMKEWLLKHQITITFQSTPIAERLIMAEWPDYPISLKVLLTAGDRLTRFPPPQLPFKFYNLYGPTEDSVMTTWAEVSSAPEQGEKYPSIGKPMANHRVYITTASGKLQPVGVPGEICIGGAGVAAGYLNNPELTDDKFFFMSEWSNTGGVKRFYRTGDLARWLADGRIEFLGRVDFQVKIRGYRIEPGEIQSVLMIHEHINEALVLVKEDQEKEKYLCAYFVAEIDIDVLSLRDFLAARLPVYMIPAYFVRLEKMPLTPNGKINRKALPDPVFTMGKEGTGPRNKIEETLVLIWSEVLNIEGPIGIDDHFFQMGGHSLKVTGLVSRIHKLFNVRIPMAEIFKRPTIRGLSEYIHHATGERYMQILRVEEREYYVLSSAQKRMYFLQQMDKTSTTYNVYDVWLLEGHVDQKKLADTFLKLIERHESFRTSFAMIYEEPKQIIHETVRFDIEYGESLNVDIFIRPFALSQAPLLRVGLGKIGETEHLLIVDMHHIIADGMSVGVLVEEFSALMAGQELPAIGFRYKDYATWQSGVKGSPASLKQENYWVQEFVDEIPVLNLPTDFARPVMQDFAGNQCHFELDGEITEALGVLALEAGVTLYMVLLALYAIFLAKLCNQEDIVIGTPIAGRSHGDLEKIIGMFVNTLPLRTYPVGTKPFTDFLVAIKECALKGFENQEYQYEELVEKLAITRDMSRNPLFDTLFALQNITAREIVIPGLTLTSYPRENKTAKFDLSLIVQEVGNTLNLTFEYSTALFLPETIARFITYFTNTVAAVLNNKTAPIGALQIISLEEKQRILYEFNNTRTDYPADKTIPQLFMEHAAQTPDHIALIGQNHGGNQLTYGELNKKSHQLAHTLINKGIVPGSIVAIQIERSLEMIIGILGILKSGAAYLPIALDYPQDRIDYMLQDSAAKLLITTQFIQDSSPIIPITPIIPSIPITPTNLAYIIYTSGSTGKPKGVLTMHHNVIRVVRNTNYIEFFPRDRVLQLSNYAFDGSVFDIYGALLNGAALVLISKEDVLVVDRLSRVIERESVTVFFITTALFNTLVDFEIKCFYSIRKVCFGGERISVEHSRKALDYLGKGRIIHVYGPTETTVYANYYFIDQIASHVATIPIGKPIANTTVYILDKHLQPVPLGISGEIVIGGAGVARGYLNNPELTQEKFISLSISSISSTKCYRTGDLARWLPDGDVEFLGRIDFQVKIRGFRIEPGEIEARLLHVEHIKEAIVMVREEVLGDKYLCAYFVADQEYDLVALRDHLAKELPEYMIPAYFMQLEKFPLNANGKIDKKVLPLPVRHAGAGYTAPRNEIERQLRTVWSDVLHTSEENPIGIDDNFFKLGGHSLKASLLVGKIHKELQVNIPLAQIFKTPTIKGVAEYIGTINADGLETYDTIPAAETKEYYPLSSVQKRLHVLQQMDIMGTGYNIPAALKLEGQLDIEKLAAAFRQFVARHESVRTSFFVLDNVPVQIIHNKVAFEFEYEKRGQAGNLARNFLRPFDLTRAPLLRVRLVQEASANYTLLVDMHHIIADGTSTAILIKEIMALYSGAELPALRIHYKDFAVWQHNEKNQHALVTQEKFWQDQFAGEIPVLNLPTDYPRPLIQSFAGDRFRFELTQTQTQSIKTLALSRDVTLYMFILAVSNIWLAKLSGEAEIIIGTPIAARRHEELQGIMGMFVNTLALQNFPAPSKTFVDFLAEVKNVTVNAFQNQDYPFEDVVDDVVKNRDIARNPLFDVLFAFQNMDIPEIVIPGLRVTPCEYENKTAKFDLNLDGQEQDGKLMFSLEYCTHLFKAETIKRFSTYFKNIMVTVLAHPGQRIATIDILDEAEKQHVLEMSNGVAEPIDTSATIHGMFAETAARNKDNTALVFGESRMTYGELVRKTNRLARLLRHLGVQRNSLVGLMVERSFEMVIGMLAILKAGGAYLAVDPKFPLSRKQFMIQDSHMILLLTNFEIDDETTNITESIPTLDIRTITTGANLTLPNLNKGSDLLYVIFTSGSTGKPKGVMLEHTNLVNLMEFQYKYTCINFSKVLQFTTISFDVSFQEIFSTLLAGGQLYLITEETRNSIPDLFQLIVRHKITTLFFPMSFLKMMFSYDINIPLPAGNIEHIVTAGEQVVVDELLRNYLKTFHIYLHNHYGPSETHVVTALTISPEDAIPTFPTIGRPVSNTAIYILDKEKTILPNGIAGELGIGGIQVGRGYLGREEETKQKYIEDMFHKEGKLYLTGDMARYLANGNIEFLGRIDHQVKIRGIRVEPGEIESQLKKLDEVRDAVVMVKQEPKGEKFLCAYVVLNAGVAWDVVKLKNTLSATLPDYMIPAYFMPLDTIPLTASGKVDRRSLPEPDKTAGLDYTAPRNNTEQLLVDMWADILTMEKEKIGIDANFFQLGGHSLKAIVLIAKIHKEFNTRIPLPELFQRPTIRGQAGFILNILHPQGESYTRIAPVEQKEYYPLSSVQKRLYFLQQLDRSGTTYNIYDAWVLAGFVDKHRLQEIFVTLTQRHESFRTSFELVQEEPVQFIHAHVPFAIEYEEYDEYEPVLKLNKFIRPFDLSQAPLWRVGLVRLAEEKHILFVDMHHIISDGKSIEIMAREFTTLCAGTPLPALNLSYKDYAAWQNEKNTLASFRTQEKYWLHEFANELPVLELPTDYSRPPMQTFAGDFMHFQLNRERSTSLKTIVLETGSTLYMVLLACYTIFLAKISHQEDIIVGTPVAGRSHDDLEKIIGMFVNTLPMRNYPGAEKTFPQFLQELKARTLKAFENQEYQYEDMVEHLVLTRNASRNPMFDTMFVVQNINTEAIEIPGLKLTPYPQENKTAKVDLTLVCSQTEQQLSCSFEYSTTLFKPETIFRFSQYFTNLIYTILEHPAQKISALTLLSSAEKDQVLFFFNHTTTAYPKDKTIPQLFIEQATRTPDHIALIGADSVIGQITYAALNKQSTQLAHYLISQGILPDTIIAIQIDRSIEMIIGILGILIAGAAYLPIALDYPQDRIDYMLQDSAAKLLITTQFIQDASPITRIIPSIPIIPILPITPIIPITPTNLAYIIYTSGSTGKPKGVLTTHANVTRVVKSTNYIDIHPSDRILQLSNYAFDGSVFDIFGALLNGAALVLISHDDLVVVNKLSNTIQREAITLFFITTALFNTLVDLEIDCLCHIKKVLFGGERISLEHSQKALDYLGKDRIIHVYGPTETTVYATAYFINTIDANAITIPIGKPISNTILYILDKSLQPAPIGISGEIYIGGAGVARGYLNNPELTLDQFIPISISTSSTSSIPSTPFYKTGDLARWLPDGNIEFLGRIDNQLKIRGFRIELGEIENCLLKIKDIKEAVVLVHEDVRSKDKLLCAYFVAKKEYKTSTLREHLSGELPDYMIPAYFKQLEKMPLTRNGKIDKNVLPEPVFDTDISNYVPPQNDIEKKLAAIWSQLLGIEKIGCLDNFFELGGHSLKAATMLAKVHRVMDIKIDLAQVFKNPTIRGLAEFIKASTEEKYLDIEPAEERSFYELSYNQKRLWFIQQLTPDSSAYNMSGILVLKQAVQQHALEKALQCIIARHESFRTGFIIVNDEPAQVIQKEATVPLKMVDLSMLQPTEKQQKMTAIYSQEATTPFDLATIPLFRVILLKLADSLNSVIFNMHHIISDGWSMEIIKREFSLFYEGTEFNPEPLNIQYKDFAVWNNKQITNREFKDKIHLFWQKRLTLGVPIVQLPMDNTSKGNERQGAHYISRLNDVQTRGLKQIAREANTTLFVVMFSLYILLLHRFSSQEEISCFIVSAGRNQESLLHILGFFVSTELFKIQVFPEESFIHFLTRVNAEVLAILEHQGYPMELVFEELNMKYPEISVAFNMLNLGDTHLDQVTESAPIHDNSNPDVSEVKFDLEPYIMEYKNGIEINWAYKKELFHLSTIKYMVSEYNQFVDFFLTLPQKSITDYLELGITYTFKRGSNAIRSAEYPPRHANVLIETFENQVKQHPQHPAIKTISHLFTYDQLNRYANRIAHFLASSTLFNPQNRTVGLLFDHGADMIAASLGVLKAGLIYVPLAPDYPGSRLSAMIQDAQSPLILTDTTNETKTIGLAQENNIQYLNINEMGAIKPETEENPDWDIETNALAYIIYTSGSTGQPKGVSQTSENVYYYIRNWLTIFSITPSDHLTLISSFSHDAAVMDIYAALLAGATLYPFNLKRDQSAGSLELSQFLIDEKITLWHSVPSLYHYFVNTLTGKEMFPWLRFIILGGEPVLEHHITLFQNYFPHATLANIYGQSEASVNSVWLVHAQDVVDKVVIGKTLDHTKIVLVNDKGRAVKPFQIGEIVVVSPHVSPGYWRNEEASRKVFTMDPEFGTEYWTGDLGRLLMNGEIEFIGRRDSQVKIRGYRIELGEIETILLKHPAINEAVVAAKKDASGDWFLVAYIIKKTTATQVPKTQEMHEYLAQTLPDYMIPAYFVPLEQFPLTASNKIDRKALPDPEITNLQAYTAPSNDTERKLTRIWADVLVLTEDKIGTQANFFELGGHSLKAATLTLKIHKEFNAKVPLEFIFKKPTIQELALYIQAVEKELYLAVEPTEKKSFYPLSSAQRRLYFLQQMDETSTVYNMSQVLKLDGKIALERLQDTFVKLVERHESFRTSFLIVAEESVQRIHETVTFEIEKNAGEFFPDHIHPSPEEIIKAFIRPFDLSQAPLLRVGIVPLAENSHLLMVDMHHIISDGTSVGLLVKEFMQFYETRYLPPLYLHYKDYAVWETQQRDTILQQGDFWLSEFADEIPLLDLPLDFVRPQFQQFIGHSIHFTLGNSNTRALKALVLQHQTTLYMVLLSVYNILLAKLCNQETIIVGTPTAGRAHVDLEHVIGMFVNTLVLKNHPAGTTPFHLFLKEVKEKTIQAFANQDYPYEDLVEMVMRNRDISRNPLFDTMFVLQNQDIPTIENPSLKLEPYTYQQISSKFDLTLIGMEIAQDISCTLEYSTQLFKPETIHRFVTYFQRIITAVLQNPEQPISHIDMLPDPEKKQLVQEFNNTAVPYPDHKTIYQLFADQVDKYPDHIALVFENQSVTFRDFEHRANQLAHYLISVTHIQPGDTLMVLLDRSIALILILMAIMKTRGAYIPMDVSLPAERLRLVLNDASVKIVLTAHNYLPKIAAQHSLCPLLHSILCIEDVQKECLAYPTTHPVPGNANDPAYVMYTSGSSGIPKGVLVTHRSIVNTIIWRKNNYEYAPGYVSMQIPPYFFDSSVTDIFTPLSGGARLVLIRDEERADLTKLRKTITTKGITHFIVVPIFYNMLLEEIAPDLKYVKMICCAGDNFPDELIRKHFERLPHVRIFNEYGPTENSVNATAYELKPTSPKAVIGKPISNVAVYVLDNHLSLCPIGVTGELCLAGSSLACGYLNRPELTAEKFVKTNLYMQPSILFYRTGDLGRWCPDGNLEFIGRLDNQVKIRGIRVEIGEIENQLMKRDDIKECVVLVKQDEIGTQSLCAYIVPHTLPQLDQPAILKEYLTQRLPLYMIPAYFLILEKLPLTPNGKLDTNALPLPQPQLVNPCASPRNELEQKMVEIWEGVLGKEHIGINDNFFYSGGDSIKSIQILSRLNRAGYKLAMKDIFQYPVIAELSAHAQKIVPIPSVPDPSASETFPLIANKKPVPIDFTYKELTNESLQQLVDVYPDVEDIYPLAPMQEGMLFHALLDKSSHSYFQQTGFRLSGDLNIPLVEKSLGDLVKRHDILRTAFVHKNTPRPLQVVLKNRPLNFYYLDISHMDTHDEKEKFVREFKAGDKKLSFDLNSDILMRVSILQLEASLYEFIWSFHHILMDGWCIGIINSEFFQIYTGYIAGISLPLPAIKPYRTYIQWLEKQDKEASRLYWENYLDSFSEQTVIIKPKLKKDAVQKRYHNKKISFVLTREQTHPLASLAARQHVTLNTVTQSLWGIVLGKYTQKEDVVFGAVVSGRPSELEGVESMVGLFINTIPVRIRFHRELKFNHLIQQIQAEALSSEAFHYYPLAAIQSHSALKQNLLDHLFAYENFPIAEQIAGFGDQNDTTTPSPLRIKLTDIDAFGQTTYDLNIVVEGSQQLSITLQYNSNAIDDNYVNQLAHHFQVAFSQVIENNELTINEITMLSPQERAQLLLTFNNTAAAYPAHKTIHQLFVEQTQRTPDHIALIASHHNGCQLTYAALNKQSTHLAHYLITQGVQPEHIVALKIERSLEMIIGIFAILQSGAAYLPIDPDYPEDRIQFMLSDSSASIQLTHQFIHDHTPITPITPILPIIPITPVTHVTPITPITPTNIAYIIYTSGTTGRPKGVMVTQENVVRLFFNERFQFEFNSRDVWTMFHSYCFDFSVWEMYGALLFGGKLVLFSRLTAMDTGLYLQILKKETVTVLNQTPSAFYRLLEEECPIPVKLLCLRYIIFGGEALFPGKLKEWQRQYPQTMLINMYGITETTVHVTFKQITQEEIQTGLSNIGTPIPTLSVYLLDKYNQLVPIGIPGEIHVGGAGVARGYLNRPHLTQEKFVSLSISSTTLYKSGDLARWLPDGNLEYLGRIDHQVKIRGFRIELGEIETIIKTHPLIKEAVVIDRIDNQRQYLCAYFTTNLAYDAISQSDVFPVQQLKESLEEKLPAYMVPACFVKLNQIPLNANGKIDRPKLPPPSETSFQNADTYLAPETPVQKTISSIWQDVLHRERIGIQDNFFDLGGNSLDLVRIANQLREKLGKDIPVAILFTYPTIVELETYLADVQLPDVSTSIPETFVMLNGSPQSNKNIFFLHEVLGDVGAYMAFAKQLGTDFNCWGVESAKLKNYVPRNDTVEEISTRYIQQIKQVQPTGPYNIFTWSWGGHLGLEMTLQLERAGEQLSFLGLVDSSGPDYQNNPEAMEFTLESERNFIKPFFMATNNPMDLDKIDNLDLLWTITVDYLASDPAMVAQLRQLLIANALALPNYFGLTGKELIQYLNLSRVHRNAGPKYKPVGKIHTPLHFFWANQNPDRVESWQDYCHNPIIYHEINGDHHSIFRDSQQIIDFAQVFREVFTQALK